MTAHRNRVVPPEPASPALIARERAFGARNYDPLPVVLAHGEGAWVTDVDGRRYLDLMSAYSAVSFGHANPYIIDALVAQARELAVTSRAFYNDKLPLLFERITKLTGLPRALPASGGAEAVETALKAVRKWAYKVKGVPADRAEVVVCKSNFHGRTITIVGFSSEPQYRDGFGPFAPGFVAIPYGDAAALEAAITPNTAAILMEPIQAEGGILFPPDGYMAALRALCTKHNVLLIWDEIQTGFCRTGKRFAWQHEDAKPDMMCLGKALGGGVMPVSAVVGSKDVLSVFKPGDHGSTFGGNPLASVIGIAAMTEMLDLDLERQSAEKGKWLLDALSALPYDFIEDVRGRGLLVGLEVKEGVDTKKLVEAFVHNGVLTKETRSRTFRYAPPLTITQEELALVVAKTKAALDAVTPAAVG